jgi:hypothetical protein
MSDMLFHYLPVQILKNSITLELRKFRPVGYVALKRCMKNAIAAKRNKHYIVRLINKHEIFHHSPNLGTITSKRRLLVVGS